MQKLSSEADKENIEARYAADEVAVPIKGIPELLLIPFDAMTGFFDPSVQFSLKFEPHAEADGDAEGKPDAPAAPVAPLTLANRPAPAAVAPASGDDEAEEAGEEAKVVSIDAFRKKP